MPTFMTYPPRKARTLGNGLMPVNAQECVCQFPCFAVGWPGVAHGAKADAANQHSLQHVTMALSDVSTRQPLIVNNGIGPASGENHTSLPQRKCEL